MSESLIEQLDRAHDLIKSGRVAEAAPMLEELAARYPDNLEAWFTLAQAEGALNRHAEAEAAFAKAAQLRPGMHEAHLNLALSRLYQSKLRDSIPAFAAARKLKPELPGLDRTLLGVLDAVLQQEPLGPTDRLQLEPMEEDPLVSVVIPTRNRTRMLKDALESVGRQTYTNWEAIVVNDAGEEISRTIESLPARAGGKITALRLKSAGGPAAARNRAIEAARGEIVAFLDDDDLFLPGHLETLVGALRGGAAGVACTLAVRVEERIVDGQRIEVERSDLFPDLRYSRALLMVRNFIPIDSWGIRRECFERYGTFDTSLSCLEDWELLLRLSGGSDFRQIMKVTAEVRARQDADANDSVSTRNPPGPVCELIYRRYPSGGNELIDLARDVYLNVQFPFSRTRAPKST